MPFDRLKPTSMDVSKIEFRILQLADRDAILQYERQILSQIQPDEMEQKMFEWKAPWRTEALEHYLPLGWSFGAFYDSKLIGYFIAQTQVFTRGLTQSLWIEHFEMTEPDAFGALLELAKKLCREKNFQHLYVPRSESVEKGMFAAHKTVFEPLIQMLDYDVDHAWVMVTSKMQDVEG